MEVFHTSTGIVHTLLALIALIALIAMISVGFVILNTKGNSFHKKMGYVYVASMIATNLTALFTQTLFLFGPFHYLAVLSLTTILFGMVWPLLLRNNEKWMYWHFQAMSWSYIGLWAAFVSEVAVRLPFIEFGVIFGLAVAFSTFFVCLIGGYYVVKYKRKLNNDC